MKKKFVFILTIIILCVFTSNIYAQTLTLTYDGKTYKYTGKTYSIKVNGEKITTTIPAVIINDTALVPAREVFEKLGCQVKWDSAGLKISIALNDKNIVMKINDNNALVNNKAVKITYPAKLINAKAMVPLRFVSEQLEMKVGWLPDEGVISIDRINEIKDVKFTDKGSREEIAVSINNYKNYVISRLTDKDRLVIDIPNSKAPEKQQAIDVKSGIVKGIRYVQADNNTARVVIDVAGQPDYKVEEKKGQLVLSIGEPAYKNIAYHNNGDRVFFTLDGAELTQGGEDFKKLFKEKYDTKNKKYTITFPSKLASLGTGVLKVNDGLIDNVEVSSNKSKDETTVVFNAKDNYFYEVFTRTETDDTAITVLKPAEKNERLVVIDAGHGGCETGAIYGGVYEKDLNLDIAKRLNTLLKGKKIKTYMIREDDMFVGLYERGYIANDLHAALFLSIHNNAMDDPDYGGTMTLYFPGGAKYGKLTGIRFAEIVQDKLLKAIKTTDRNIVQRPNLVVLKSTVMPSALAEVAFMSNKKDMASLQKEEFRQSAAEGLCNAVIQALSEAK